VRDEPRAILVQQRPEGSHLAGKWEFPGGKLEPDESWEEALVREVKEELGCACVPAGIFEEKTFDYPEKRVRLRFYWAALEGEPRGERVRWVTGRELLSLDVPDANKELLPRLVRVLDEETPEEEPRGARQLGALAWAVFLLPVAFVIATLVFLTLDNLFSVKGRDMGKLLEARFPLHLIGGNRAIFLGLLVAAWGLLWGWVHLRTARRGRA
jgi:8-oxo-dGTP diphosphatase